MQQDFPNLVGSNRLASLPCLNIACFFRRGSLEERIDTLSTLADESVAEPLLNFSCATLWDLSPTLLGLLRPVARVGKVKGVAEDRVWTGLQFWNQEVQVKLIRSWT